MTIKVTQWADSVIDFSSQYSTGSWSAQQVLGEPNTFDYGDRSTAWTASSSNGTIEFLTVGFDTPVFATAAMVRETYGNGFVTKVEVLDLMDEYHEVWSGEDPSLPGTPVNFKVDFSKTSFLVQGLRVTIDTDHSTVWEEIDAIQLEGKINGNTFIGTTSKDIASGDGNNNTFYGLLGNDTLSGGGGADTLYGNFGNDNLDGGAGNDTMTGGAGNDTYFVDSAGDLVIEGAGEGKDTVKSKINYTLGNQVEKLILTGTANRNGTGNKLKNTINGNNGNNVLKGKGKKDIINGKSGDDTLVGGAGNDVLTGGAGSDAFVFNSKTEGVDTIKDFVSGTDEIHIDRDSFGGGLAKGVLPAGRFVLGTAAQDANDRFIYNFQTEELFFDADGNGSGAKIQLALLSEGPHPEC